MTRTALAMEEPDDWSALLRRHYSVLDIGTPLVTQVQQMCRKPHKQRENAKVRITPHGERGTDSNPMSYGNVVTREMCDLISGGTVEYSYCGHPDCDLGVDGDGRVKCSGRYCADSYDYEPPDWAYYNGEEDYVL